MANPNSPDTPSVGFATAGLVQAPRPAADVCPICGDLRTGPLCDNCVALTERLGHELTAIEPITMYRRAMPIRNRLRFYKEPHHPLHRPYQHELTTLLKNNPAFAALGNLNPDAICWVPSTRERFAHPLPVLIAAATHLPVTDLLHTNTTSEQAQFTANGCDRLRIVIVDDVYTTGATLQTAISALRKAGAQILTAIVIGRRINPDATPQLHQWWNTYCAPSPLGASPAPHHDTGPDAGVDWSLRPHRQTAPPR